MADTGYVCSSCGKVHEGLPTDWGFGLPCEVYALSYLEKYRRSRSNSDLCTLDERRYFLRGILLIPFIHQEGDFCWGIWAEVSRGAHDFYLENFSNELAQGTVFSGRLANRIPGIGKTEGLEVRVEIQSTKSRPLISFAEGSTHGLAVEQRVGIGSDRHHYYLESCGYFEE